MIRFLGWTFLLLILWKTGILAFLFLTGAAFLAAMGSLIGL